MTFDKILEKLRLGHVFTRLGWTPEKMEVIFKQNEDHISKDFIPNLYSIPYYARKVFDGFPEKTALHFKNQVVKLDLFTGNATNYVPSWEDLFADDWYQLNEETNNDTMR